MKRLSDLEPRVGKPTSFKSLCLRYGLALVFVSVALFVSLLVHPYLPEAVLLLFLAAILASGWFGGVGPGLFAVAVSVMAMTYYFIPPYRDFSMNAEEVPYVVSFLVSGIIASWISSARRMAEEKQKAHLDELSEESKRSAEALLKAKSELTHLSRVTAMGELVASIAHEVNQPIGAIVTNANAAQRWLKQQPPNPREVDEALARIVQDANRAGAVIGRIRALVKKAPAQVAFLDMNELVNSVLALTEHEIRRGGVDLHTELPTVPPVWGDRIQLQQVMLNLIMNAIDAMSSIHDRRRELRFRLSCDGNYVLVQVQDSGVGWDSQTAERMFDPFFSTKPEGVGMGLTISYSIIEAHGGRLRAELASPHGAILSFTLPVETRPS